MYHALMEQWAEIPPLPVSVMLAAGIKPSAGPASPVPRSAGTDPNTFHEVVAHLGMKRGKPFVAPVEFDRLFKEFTKHGNRRQN